MNNILSVEMSSKASENSLLDWRIQESDEVTHLWIPRDVGVNEELE
ncbi:hypothetical protein [Vibrio sp. PID17_43]|nr:hypothetical protein [Vibrio sp. PID17_43]